MEHIILNDTVGGIDGVINPGPYLEQLATFADDLPAGAREFATASGHYDFGGKRCVKDLKLDQLRFGDDGTWLEIHFGHNCWKHDEDLVLRYLDVSSVTAELALGGLTAARRDVVLDEILPLHSGFSHEIACWGGAVRVTARDLAADWVDVNCPDKPGAHH